MLDTLDIAAWVSYAGLFLFGVTTSFAGVRKAWHPYAPQWVFFETWALFVGQAVLPLLLLWLLDLLRVLHDTSLAGVAIIVAGYLAIIQTGQIEGANPVQQTGAKQAASWLKPFVLWLERIRTLQNKRAAMREQEIRHLVRTEVRRAGAASAPYKKLQQVAEPLTPAADWDALQRQLEAFRKDPEPVKQLGIDPFEYEINAMLDAVLRHPDAEEALTAQGFSLDGPARLSWRRMLGLVPPVLLLILMLYLIAPIPFACFGQEGCRAGAWERFMMMGRVTTYSMFRLTKTWTTEEDLARNEKYVIDQLTDAERSEDERRFIVDDLVWALQAPGLPTGRDQLIIRILFRSTPGDVENLCRLGLWLAPGLYAQQDGVRDNVHVELVGLARRLGDNEAADASEKLWQAANRRAPGFLNQQVASWTSTFNQLCQAKPMPIR